MPWDRSVAGLIPEAERRCFQDCPADAGELRSPQSPKPFGEAGRPESILRQPAAGDPRRSDADPVMKFRSAVLIACLIIVPMLAMVSHKIPTATRVAVRQRLCDPVVGRLFALLGLGHAPATGQPPAGADAGEPHDATRSAIATTEPAAPVPAVPAARSLEHSPSPVPAMEPSVTPAPQAILAAAESSPPIGGTAGRESLEARLRALGATSIDWTPAQGGDGLHRCSCRIPAEPTGQLHRVFQSAASDPVAALDNLVGQVTAWSMRTGAVPGSGVAVDPSAPLRR